MKYSGDFAFGRYNLGNLFTALNRPEEALNNYLAAIRIDDLFIPAKVNLAMLYNQKNENEKAETLLREVTMSHPEMHEISYSLGLLLAEMKKYDQAVTYLEKAARGMPKHARIHYNLGLIYQYLQRDAAAEVSLLNALSLDTNNIEYLYALADHYLKRGQLQKAKTVSEKIVAKHPGHRIGNDLLEMIERMSPKKNQ